jgi:phosphoesterase RecJ-like protein
MYEKEINLIKYSKTIAVICHINPDGDTLGASLALFSALRKLGSTVDLFSSDKIPEKFFALPNIDCFNVNVAEGYDLAIAVDCNEVSRLGNYSGVFSKAKKTLIVDHHVIDGEIKGTAIIEPERCATCLIVYDFLKEIEKKVGLKIIDRDIAANLYAGILTDSGAFTFSSVDKDTFKTIHELFSFNFGASQIAYEVYRKKSKPAFLLSSKVLHNAKFFEKDRIAIIVFRKEDFENTGANYSDTEGVVNSILNVATVEIALSIAEVENNFFKISIRTKENANANSIAKVFGGGGHKYAAGCKPRGNIYDITERLIKACQDELMDL